MEAQALATNPPTRYPVPGAGTAATSRLTLRGQVSVPHALGAGQLTPFGSVTDTVSLHDTALDERLRVSRRGVCDGSVIHRAQSVGLANVFVHLVPFNSRDSAAHLSQPGIGLTPLWNV